MNKFFRVIRDFILMIRDKIEERLPERYLTHLGKVRRLVLIEEKREMKNKVRKQAKAIKNTFNKEATELISTLKETEFDRPGAKAY